jgi:hypothetical protein
VQKSGNIAAQATLNHGSTLKNMAKHLKSNQKNQPKKTTQKTQLPLRREF